MHKRWRFHLPPDNQAVASMAAAIGVDSSIASLLIQKEITSFDQAKSYFRPSLAALHDPWAMKDMDKAVQRLIQALQQQEPILVYGDYDVDGVTSVAMFYGFIKNLHDPVQFYIPDRYTEGYGLSQQAVNLAIETDFKLIITLDCGIKAINCIQQAQAAGIDVIVCDHHEPGEELPPAYAILDPKQPGCSYPFQSLSGCGVGFKLLQALCIQTHLPIDRLYSYLDLVAISIACDLVPMVGENRILAYHGLTQLNTQPRPGIQAIIQAAALTPPLSSTQLVFSLGPRLNAAGRIAHGNLAVHLLLSEDPATANQLAHDLNQKNNLRKYLDSNITQEALQMIQSNPQIAHAKSTVLFKEDWHKGVIGIVASRCIEHYYRPTIILTASGNKATGSARSVTGFNIYEAIMACADLLDQYGGHAYAAGLTLPLVNISAFQERFEAVVASSIMEDHLIPTQVIDLPLSLQAINNKFYRVLKQMAPFGNGNMKTVFASHGVIARSYRILQEKHLKLYVTDQSDSGCTLEAIGFGLAHQAALVSDQKPFNMAYTIDENHYQGNQTLQLIIKDLQPL
jgi:single-stranded-DNA-specific exonuclease